MAQNYGLGRGLASLIPQKRKSVPFGGSQPGDEAEKKVVEPKEDFNYFGASAAPGSVAAAIKANPVSTASPKNSGAEKDNGAGNEIREVEMIKIVPNPHQPRLSFNDEKLEELAGSIKEHGIIQPITVTKNKRNSTSEIENSDILKIMYIRRKLISGKSILLNNNKKYLC